MMNPTFRNWLGQQTYRSDPVGDLAKDTAEDRSCWRGRTANSLVCHLNTTHREVSEIVLEAVQRASREYEARTPIDWPAPARPDIPHERGFEGRP